MIPVRLLLSIVVAPCVATLMQMAWAVPSQAVPGPGAPAAGFGAVPQPAAAPAAQDRPVRLVHGAQSMAVRELQVRLRHAKYLAVYDVDGIFGPMTEAAVRALQRDVELPVDGVVDAATWDELRARSQPPTAAELENRDIGPWYVNPAETVFMMELQDRLQQLGAYREAITGVLDVATRAAIREWRERSGLPVSEVVDERAWSRLLARTHNPSYADLFSDPPGPGILTQELDLRCLVGRVVCISKEQGLLSWVVDGEPRLTREARFAMPGMESPEGEFRIWYKNRDTVSRIFGERIPMPYAFFYKGNVAVHFSQDFAERGYAGGSHGCSQLDDYQAAKWLYEQVRVGGRVVVY